MPDYDVLVQRIPETHDQPYRLGRHIRHDSRSWNYRVAPVDAPVSVRWTREAPVFDQGNLGSCTGNAAAGWVGTDDSVRKGDAAQTETQAVAIYSAATKLDDYPGSYPPDDTGSDGLSVAKVLVNLKLAASYLHAFSVADVKSMLQSGPCMVGSNWYDGMFNPDPKGLVTVSGAVAGGHEYDCIGWDSTTGLFEFVNSWGTSWGVAGHFFMTESTLTRLLSEGGDVTQPQPVAVTPTPPGPTPPGPSPKPPKPTPAVIKWLEELLAWLKSL